MQPVWQPTREVHLHRETTRMDYMLQGDTVGQERVFEGYPFRACRSSVGGLHGVGKDKPGVELMSSEGAPWGKLSPKVSWVKEQQRHKI